MKRIALMVFRLLYIIPYWFPKLVHMSKSDKYTWKEKYDFLRQITVAANRAGRVTIDVHGEENLPEKDGYILYPNHQGMFDALAIMESDPHPFSIVMKKEVKDIFFLKQVFAMVGAIPIDREDVRQSMQVILQVAKEVSEGRNFIIFAEGTRSRNGNELLPFKGGSFKSAMRAKAPIVPVALIDSYVPFDRNTIRKTTVQVHFLKPICYEEYKNMKSTEIAEEVRSRIEKTIKENIKKEN
ncbi:MAG: lysophospholipid acyltransferase family protein [Lachnospiraceae bacterium]|nr:lysophospholipid acyltransferase family protein [Lachnospiraceae bacterium]